MFFPMRFKASLRVLFSRFRPRVRRHQTLIVLLLLLTAISVSSRLFLSADILSDSAEDGGDASSSMSEEYRSCTTEATPFEGVKTMAESKEILLDRMDKVFDERETYLASPSSWSCVLTGAGDDAPVIELRSLADELHGWKYRSPADTDVDEHRPVTFVSFDTIVAEFERAYECKLYEFYRSAPVVIAINRDLDDPREYCCSPEQTCVQRIDDNSCASGADITDSPDCDNACEIIKTHGDIARTLSYQTRILLEIRRARRALDHTIRALSSLEASYAYSKQLTCFQRASLDLRNQMSLLADTVSCMPRIWDAVTSLHDRRE
jgi:hypothetical protein